MAPSQNHRHQHRPKPASDIIISSATGRPKDPTELSFTSDRKGDDQNLQYGSLDKYKVPRYRTAGYGRLLGLDRRHRIVSVSDTKREVNDDTDDSTRLSRDVPSLAATTLPDEDTTLQIVSVQDPGFVDQDDFVALSLRGRRKRRKVLQSADEVDEMAGSASDTEARLSDSPSDSELVQTIDSKPDYRDAFEQFRNHPDNKKHIELMNRTSSNPTDARAWRELIDHQERYFMLSSGSGRGELRPSEKHTVADMRISLYEKALGSVSDPAAREELHVGYLAEGSRLWDTKKQLDTWRSVLRQPPSLRLWYRFLDFQQSNAIAFSYDNCLETYAEVFGRVRDLDGDEHDLQFCYVILRLTTFMHQAGYSERSIAIWQALLEYNFARPQGIGSSIVLEAFEQFWDSETARIGEKHAKGWRNMSDTEVKPKVDEPLPRIDKNRVYMSWVKEESRRSSRDIMPARTLDDTVEDDPFRIIIFSDIKQFLVRVKTEPGKTMLLNAFLKFCNLPPLDGTYQQRQWWTDPFLSSYNLSSSRGVSDSSNLTNIVFFQSDTSTLFPDPLWYSVWPAALSDNEKLDSLGLNALTQLVDLRPQDDRLAEYVLALRFHKDPGFARKMAKRLLKRRPDSLVLYNAYALMEARSGKFDAAEMVWLTALSMGPSLGEGIQNQSIRLWRSLVWELLLNKDEQVAVRVVIESIPKGMAKIEELTILPSPSSYTPAQRLQAELFYRNHIADSLSLKDYTAIAAYTELLAVFKYLTSERNLEESCSSFDSTLDVLHLGSDRSAIELLHQSRARLLHLHASLLSPSHKPAQIVNQLRRSLATFPGNTILHDLYNHYSRRAGLIDRLRSTESLSPSESKPSNGSQRPSTLPSLLKIQTELSRPSYSSTSHSIRSAFTTATKPDNPAFHYPQIWLTWLNGELSLLSDHYQTSSITNSTSTKRVKELYLSSLRACPWCKELYLMGFGSEILRTAMGKQWLKEVYRGMMERGLRIRFDIEEELEDT